MIDDILKLILAFPELDLSSDANIELLRRTSDLGDELSVETFHKHIADKRNGYCCFSRYESKQIINYLTHLDNFKRQMARFSDYFHFAFRICHPNKMLTGDDLLPLFICMMPDDLPTLEKLISPLIVLINIDKIYYYGAVLQMAVNFLVNEKKHPPKTTDNAANDEMLFYKSKKIIALLRDDFILLDITINLANTFHARITQLEKNKENETLSQSNIRQAYHELYHALVTNEKSLPARILEIIKVCTHSEDLQNDFAKTTINLTEAMNSYLALPPKHQYSLFRSRHLHHSEILLTTLFTHLDAKLKTALLPNAAPAIVNAA